MVEELGEWCANQEFFCCACAFRVTASKPLWCYLIPAGWLPDSGQKAKTTETRTSDLEASAAQSGLSFLGCLAQVHGWRGILERRSLSGQLPSGRGTSLWFCLASLGSFLGPGGFRFFVGQCRSDAWGIAGLRAHWAMWFSLSHAVHNHDLSALRCCRDRCLRTFSHLGPEFCGRPTPRQHLCLFPFSRSNPE